MPLRPLLPAGALAFAVAFAPISPATADEPRPRHSSDGVVGELATPLSQLPADARRVAPRTTTSTSRLGPGVKLTRLKRTDARGRIAATVLAVKWRNPRVRIDYLNAGKVARTRPVSQMVKGSKRVVAAINGDFFDIGDTGAPFGLGKELGADPLHAQTQGFNAAFHLVRGRAPALTELQLVAQVRQHPDWVVTNVNSPSVAPDGIGVYTKDWGSTVGTGVTDGQTSDVRVAYIRKGRVQMVRKKLSAKHRIEGKVLVGRGAGADLLRTLHNGDPISVRWALPGGVKMAISGNKILVRNGIVETTDDGEMHPRTSVGIDQDTGTVLMVVVDGRQRPRSRGLTMLELANLMVELGAEQALNLDGGGSSTMVARGAEGRMKVRNKPSDRRERAVPNGLQVRILKR
ncbi:phosphodiester glycosidase family protein [Nocardioides pantholopis]|uniref:phosphodiester glycosidase family protein n=1 Tax=Nocardioides pantholopis TaxID=2483798 RepID=UPI000F09913D|nr:phosphodiester glycosidase family protein [Nocardioides pantholopis]